MLLNKLSGRLRDADFWPCYVAPQFDVATGDVVGLRADVAGCLSGTAGNRPRCRFGHGKGGLG